MTFKQPICGVTPNGLYVLSEDYTYRFGGLEKDPPGVVTGTLITVPEGFVWDGASAPIRSSVRKDGLIRAAALIHDYLYRNLGRATDSLSFSRKGADRLFRAIMLKAGMSRWKAGKAYFAVRWFGWLAWNKHKRNHKLAERNAGERVL